MAERKLDQASGLPTEILKRIHGGVGQTGSTSAVHPHDLAATAEQPMTAKAGINTPISPAVPNSEPGKPIGATPAPAVSQFYQCANLSVQAMLAYDAQQAKTGSTGRR